MNTKDVCKKFDITLKSLRIYEEYGIVIPKREENNYRNYSNDDLFKLRTAMLLKELGFSLKDIKKLIDKNNYADTNFVRELYLQVKAVESKMNELDNIRNTLISSIDKMLETSEELSYYHFLSNIDTSLKENRSNRRRWVDMWGFDNKAVKFDKWLEIN